MSSIFAHTSPISLLFSMSLKISVIFDDRLPLLSNPSLASLAWSAWQSLSQCKFGVQYLANHGWIDFESEKNIANHGRIKNRTAELCPKWAQCTSTPVHQYTSKPAHQGSVHQCIRASVHQGISTPGSVHQAWQEIMTSIIQPLASPLAHLYKMSLGLKTSLCGAGLK